MHSFSEVRSEPPRTRSASEDHDAAPGPPSPSSPESARGRSADLRHGRGKVLGPGCKIVTSGLFRANTGLYGNTCHRQTCQIASKSARFCTFGCFFALAFDLETIRNHRTLDRSKTRAEVASAVAESTAVRAVSSRPVRQRDRAVLRLQWRVLRKGFALESITQ